MLEKLLRLPNFLKNLLKYRIAIAVFLINTAIAIFYYKSIKLYLYI